MKLKAPETVFSSAGFCPGCGHGLATRLIGEVSGNSALNASLKQMNGCSVSGISPISKMRLRSFFCLQEGSKKLAHKSKHTPSGLTKQPKSIVKLKTI